MLTLDNLSEGSGRLDAAYSEALKRVDGQLQGDRLLAKRTLCWISYAKRLLTTAELQHALGTQAGDRAFDNNKLYEIEDITSVCAGLVTVDEETNIIRLVHYTTQEYLEQVRLSWNPGAQEEIAVACLTYLSFDTFRSGSCTNDEVFEQRLAKNAFFDYSARYWSEHVRPVQNYTADSALAFLLCNDLVQCTSQGALIPGYRYQSYSQHFPSQSSGLHLTTRCGLLHLTEELLEDSNFGVDVDLKDSYGRTPLSYAATRGHEAVVRLLLDTGKVDAESKDASGRTPLLYAAAYGHETVVRLLLDTGKVDAESKDSYGQTSLSYAAENGHEAVVKRLHPFTSSFPT
jgi:hypothetical protein